MVETVFAQGHRTGPALRAGARAKTTDVIGQHLFSPGEAVGNTRQTRFSEQNLQPRNATSTAGLLIDRAGIAARLRELLTSRDDADLDEIARRLQVEGAALRTSIDEVSPHPAEEVLAAVIREYGIDPTWLFTGVYDPATHRRVIAGECEPIDAVNEFLTGRPVRIADPPPEPFRFHDQR